MQLIFEAQACTVFFRKRVFAAIKQKEIEG